MCVSPCLWVSFPLFLFVSILLSRCFSFCLHAAQTALRRAHMAPGPPAWQPQPSCAGDLTLRTSADVFVADLPQVRSLCGQVVEGAAPPGCERRRVPGFGLGQRSWGPGAPRLGPQHFRPTQASPHRSCPPGPAQPPLIGPSPSKTTPLLAHTLSQLRPTFSRPIPTTLPTQEVHAPCYHTPLGFFQHPLAPPLPAPSQPRPISPSLPRPPGPVLGRSLPLA